MDILYLWVRYMLVIIDSQHVVHITGCFLHRPFSGIIIYFITCVVINAEESRTACNH